MRILGVDPGSITTGFGVIDHVAGKIALIEHGSIKTPKGEELSVRLEIIHRTLAAIIERTQPAAVAVETPFAGLNLKSLIQLSHARGVILLAARTAGLEIFEYAPRSVKSAVVGYGAAEKEQVAKMVRLLIPALGKSAVTPDAADALAIAICHAHSARMRAVR